MKICIYSDPHWSMTSSIFTQQGVKFSRRLENLLDSMNWVGQLAKSKNCDRIICAGDFFHKDTLNAEEITALKQINWTDIPKQFLLGNHELMKENQNMHSLNTIYGIGEIIDSPKIEYIGNTNLIFVPYIDEDNKVPLRDIISQLSPNQYSKTIIISHNDIKGIRYGKYVSEMGFGIDEIESCCDLYFNGHLHNGAKVTNKIINIGNLTGQNFTEDGFKYKHGAYILDTDTLEYEFYENEKAVNFYKVFIDKVEDINIVDRLPIRSIAKFYVKESLVTDLKTKLKDAFNLITYQLIVVPDGDTTTMKNISESLNKVNHLDELVTFCVETLGDFEILRYELNEIIKEKGLI